MKIIEKILLLKKIGISFSEIERKIGITKNSLSIKIKNKKNFGNKVQKKIEEYFVYLIKELKKGLKND